MTTKGYRWTALCLAFFALLVPLSLALGQPGAGAGQGGGQAGPGAQFAQGGGLGGLIQQIGGAIGGGLMGLLQRPEIQKEIQLNDEQLAAVQELAAEQRGNMQGRMQEMFSGMRQGNAGGQSFAERLRASNADANTGVEKQLGQILRPFQLARLKEIDVQQQVQQGGANALTSGPVGDVLALDEAQRQQVQQRNQEINQELEAQIRKLRADAQTKLINSLPRNKRAKLQDMMGKPFDLPPQTIPGLPAGLQPGSGGQFQFQLPQGGGQPVGGQ